MKPTSHTELREEVQKIMSSYALNCQGWPKSAQMDVDKMVDLLLSKRQEWVEDFARWFIKEVKFHPYDDGDILSELGSLSICDPGTDGIDEDEPLEVLLKVFTNAYLAHLKENK